MGGEIFEDFKSSNRIELFCSFKFYCSFSDLGSLWLWGREQGVGESGGGMGVHAHGHVKHDIHEGDHLQFLYMYINLSSMIPVGGLSLMS